MPYAVKFSRLAAHDLQKICDWYENQSSGLSDRFLVVLQKIVEQISADPYRFMESAGGSRVALVRKFPYKVFYMVNEPKVSVRVIAVIHRSRHSKEWQERL